MDNKVLENIFGNKSEVTVYGTVSAILTPIKCSVVDVSGKTYIVENQNPVSIGEKVLIKSGEVFKAGTQSGTHRTYKV